MCCWEIGKDSKQAGFWIRQGEGLDNHDKRGFIRTVGGKADGWRMGGEQVQTEQRQLFGGNCNKGSREGSSVSVFPFLWEWFRVEGQLNMQKKGLSFE